MRSTEQRRADAIEKLEHDPDVWVATADGRGVAHLVPLSLCWHGGEVIVATTAGSRTARNVSASAQARLALGTTRDVVIIDAVATVVARSEVAPATAAAFRDRTEWDPGADGGAWVYVRARPERVQVWRNEEEIDGRTVMRDGAWLS
jgi:hypothetical protein